MDGGNKLVKISLANTSFSLLFFYLFIFCLPFFRRVEILTDYSYLDGRFIDYLTYSVYGFEVFFAAALLFWISEIIRGRRKILVGDFRVILSWIGVIVFSVISFLFASSMMISFYYVLVLLGLLLVCLFVINKVRSASDYFLLLNVFIFSVFLQGILAIAQFIKNGSVGLYLLGEQIISSDTAGVAKVMIGGAKHIRPYGTFSHTNVLALFLLASGVVVWYLFSQFKNRRYRIYLTLVAAVLAVSLLLTFSRAVWVAALFLLGMIIVRNLRVGKIKLKVKNPYSLIVILVFILACVFLGSAIWWRINPFLSTTWESLWARDTVLLKSLILIRRHPFGIGIGNFIIEIAYLLTGYPLWMIEPAHNVFIIAFAEIGIFGFLSFLSFLYFVVRGLKKTPVFLQYIFAAFIFLMFFDHYFWDIRQAQILLFLFVGLAISPLLKKD